MPPRRPTFFTPEDWSDLNFCRDLSIWTTALVPFRTARRQELRLKIGRLIRIFRQSTSTEFPEEFVQQLNQLAGKAKAVETAFVVWVDLVEVLVRAAEEASKGKPNSGAIKKRMVLEAMLHLAKSGKLGIPTDSPLTGVFVEFLGDILIDAVVVMYDEYSLWGVPQFQSLTFRERLTYIWDAFGAAVTSLTVPFVWLFTRIRRLLTGPTKLPPELIKALKEVEDKGLLMDHQQLLDLITGFFKWVARNRNNVVAAIEVVFAVVRLAEDEGPKRGPDKKAFARDLLLAVLDELGFMEKTGLLFAVIDSMLNGAIEGSVHLFNKRGAFS